MKTFYAFSTELEDEPDGLDCIAQFTSPADYEKWLDELKAEAIKNGEDPQDYEPIQFFRVTVEKMSRTANAEPKAQEPPAGGKS